ncbi:hypothetical protein [Streptomyces sp. CA2R101]
MPRRLLTRRERLTLIGIAVSSVITGLASQTADYLLHLLPWR